MKITKKPLLLFEGSVLSISGYGVHSRLLVRSLLAMDKFEVVIFPTPWGNTPSNALDQNDEENEKIFSCIRPNLDRKPDIHIQVSIPSEFRPLGTYSIGVTAGTEVTIAPLNFVEGCERMDLILVPSKFTRDVLVGTKYDRKDEQGNIIDTKQVTKPVEILFEGISTETFKKTNQVSDEVERELSQVTEDFAFLFVGHWLNSKLFEDRKDVSGLVYTFLNSFKNKKKRPALILKVSGAGFSITERDQIIERIHQIYEMVRDEGFQGKLPNVYLLNGELTDSQMNELYNHSKVKAMVSFTKAEGYGLPLAEFATTGKPIICSAYSGHMDFLNSETSVLLPGSLKKIDGSAANEWLPKEGEWFSVSYQYAGQVLGDVFENYGKYLEKSRKTPKFIKENFSFEKMTADFLEILEKNCMFVADKEPKLVQIKLPPLKKIT